MYKDYSEDELKALKCLDAELGNSGYPSGSRRGAGDESRNQVNSESIRAQ